MCGTGRAAFSPGRYSIDLQPQGTTATGQHCRYGQHSLRNPAAAHAFSISFHHIQSLSLSLSVLFTAPSLSLIALQDIQNHSYATCCLSEFGYTMKFCTYVSRVLFSVVNCQAERCNLRQLCYIRLVHTLQEAGESRHTDKYPNTSRVNFLVL